MQAHSVQQTWLGYAVTVAIIMFIMALRFRRMGQIRPLKLETLWIVPAIYLVVAVLMFRQLSPTGWVGFASAAGLLVGAAVGWQRGKMMHIHVDSQTHALNQKASPAAMMFLMALIAVRISGQGFLGSEGVRPPSLHHEEAPLMRYLPLSDADRSEMLRVIGASSIDELFRDVPQQLRLEGPIEKLPLHASEMAVERHMTALSRKSMVAGDVPFFLGCGAYKHHIPASVDHLIQRGEFLTSYTPYQPEIAQGTLQMMFEFQTQVARLFGCEVANASMYDGSTAMWEAIVMAHRITRKNKTVISSGVHPHYVSVAKTMAKFTEDRLDTALPELTAKTDAERLIADIDAETSAVVVQYPDILGRITDLTPIAEAAHAQGALLITVVTEPVALGLIKAPGEMGADIVVGEGQSIGVGLQFGGPYVGLFATREKYVRQMPGRLAGETVDAEGKRGFVLTLSTREQHIRREKATSNICTSSVLCALAFTIHLALLGEEGLRRLAFANHHKAMAAARKLAQIPGIELVNDTYFNEFTLRLPVEARPAVHSMVEKGVLGGVSLGRLYPGVEALQNGLVVAVTETATDEDFGALEAALKEVVQ